MAKGRRKTLLGEKGQIFPRVGFRAAARKSAIRAQAQDLVLAQLLHLDTEMPARQVKEGRLDELIGSKRRGARIGSRVAAARFGAHQAIEKHIEGWAIGGGRRPGLVRRKRRLRRLWLRCGSPIDG